MSQAEVQHRQIALLQPGDLRLVVGVAGRGLEVGRLGCQDAGGRRRGRRRNRPPVACACRGRGDGLLALSAAQEPEGENRYHSHGDDQRGDEGDGHGDREGTEQLTRDAGDHGHRQEHRHRGGGGRRDRAGHLLDGGDDVGRGQRGVSGVAALDVLEHHDGVVDHASDRHREGRQGEDVQRESADLQTDHGDQQRQRDGDGGDQRRAHRHQEQQDHQHREPESERALDREVVDRLLDQRRLVEDDAERGVVAHRLLQAGKCVGDGVRDGHRVAVGLLEHRHAECRSPVGPGQRGRGDRLDLDVGDLRQRDRTVAGRDRESVDLLDRVGGVAHLHGQLEGLVVRGAGRDDRQLGLDGLGDGRGRQVALGQVVRAQGDGQLGGVLAGDLDLAYALDRGQCRYGHVLHELARVRQRQVGGGGRAAAPGCRRCCR